MNRHESVTRLSYMRPKMVCLLKVQHEAWLDEHLVFRKIFMKTINRVVETFSLVRRLCDVQRVLALLLAVVTTSMVVGCQSTPQPPMDNSLLPLAGPGTADYATNFLQQGDVVGITFQYSTNFNTTQKITIDGLLNLESVGQVRAAGMTAIGFCGASHVRPGHDATLRSAGADAIATAWSDVPDIIARLG